MKTSHNSFTDWLWTLLILLLLGLLHSCVAPLLSYAAEEVWLWLSTPTPTPVPLPLGVNRDDVDGTARTMLYGWLREQRGLRATPDPALEDKAYYLAGEAPRLRSGQWPQWPGLRYAVGPASGAWRYYASGCLLCLGSGTCGTLPAHSRSLATTEYPGLDAADRVGAAVAWREGQQYVAVVWPAGTCPTPQPTPTFTGAGPEGPGW